MAKHQWRSNRIAVDEKNSRPWKNLNSKQRRKKQLANKISQAVAREIELAHSVAMERGQGSQGGGSESRQQRHQCRGANEPTGRRGRDRGDPRARYRGASSSLDARRFVQPISKRTITTPRQPNHPPHWKRKHRQTAQPLPRRGYVTGDNGKSDLKPRPPNHPPPLTFVKTGCDQRKRKYASYASQSEAEQEPQQMEPMEDEEQMEDAQVEEMAIWEVLKKPGEDEEAIEERAKITEEEVAEKIGVGGGEAEAMDAYVELAHDWDSEDTGRWYTQKEFLQQYGAVDGRKHWETAKYATEQAAYAVEEMSKDYQMEHLVKLLLPEWMHRPDGELAPETFRAFYVPLRWRAEYLQKHCVAPDEWASYNLSGESSHTWNHVKAFIIQRCHLAPVKVTRAETHLRTSERQKIRSKFELLVRRFAKSTRLTKAILSTGLASLIHVHTDAVVRTR